MNQEQVEKAKTTEETWVTTGNGKVYVNTTNLEGRTISTEVGGRPDAILRITTYDRMRNQETCVDRVNDPFTNGMLVRMDADQQQDPTTKSPNALSKDQIEAAFLLSKVEFREMVAELGEYNVRRMLELVPEMDATQSQVDCLRETLESKWPIGGAMPIYDELKGLGQVATLDR
jgi:hypothetical protein